MSPEWTGTDFWQLHLGRDYVPMLQRVAQILISKVRNEDRSTIGRGIMEMDKMVGELIAQ